MPCCTTVLQNNLQQTTWSSKFGSSASTSRWQNLNQFVLLHPIGLRSFSLSNPMPPPPVVMIVVFFQGPRESYPNLKSEMKSCQNDSQRKHSRIAAQSYTVQLAQLRKRAKWQNATFQQGAVPLMCSNVWAVPWLSVYCCLSNCSGADFFQSLNRLVTGPRGACS